VPPIRADLRQLIGKDAGDSVLIEPKERLRR
jgi:hypothetical protein